MEHSRRTIINELWRRGKLVYKLDACQKELYNLYYNGSDKLNVWLLARRSGKTYCLCVLALEACLRQPNAIVKFLAPTKLQLTSILRPLIKTIIEDCPEHLKPEFKSKDYIYYFPNGSELQLAGADSGHAEKLRGGDASLAIVDEAGTVDDLEYIVKSILFPTTLITKGKVILASTPPRESDHDFLKFIEQAEERKILIKKTIDDNPRITPEQRTELIAEVGGVHTDAARRELYCVDEDTLIKTLTGYRKIKDVEVGSLVWTHKGRYRKVLNKFLNPIQDRRVYRVACSNNMGVICTEGHQLYIATSNRRELTNGYTEGWQNVEEININRATKRVYFKVPIENSLQVATLDEDAAYLSGYFTAEGSISKTTQTASLTLNYFDNFKRINECSKKLFGKEFKIYQSNSGCFQATICSKVARTFFSKFGVGASNKKIPTEIKYAPRSIKISFLKGLWSGDGYLNHRFTRGCLTSTSISLIADASEMLLSLGIPNQINKTKSAGPSKILGRDVTIKDCYSLKVFGENFDKLASILFEVPSPCILKSSRNIIKDGYLFSRIHKIEQIQYNKPIVYDIEIEEDHSYVGLHTVFHNCEIVRDPTTCVIPEFTPQLAKEIIKEWPRPPFFDSYVSMDLGFKDLTAVLFGYYDFRADKIIIEDEIPINFSQPNNNLKTLTEKIEEKERTLWFNPITQEIRRPTARVSDINYIVTQEISIASGNAIHFIATKKDEKAAAVNHMKILLAAKKIIIHPRCTTLISHLEHCKWSNPNNTTTFARSDSGHHYDFVDALVYFVRTVAFGKNPYPSSYDFNLKDLYVYNPLAINNASQAEQIYKIFNKKSPYDIRRR